MAGHTEGIDTSRVRVTGRGRIDLEAGDLRLTLTPKAKKPAFFSLATPVGVRGSVDDPEIDISAWEVTKSVGRFLASIVTVPIQLLYVKPMPEDGSEACIQDLERVIDEILADGP